MLNAKLYHRLILPLYPAQFRDEFGPEMVVDFEDQCSDARAGLWLLGVVCVWVMTLFTLPKSVWVEWREQKIRLIDIKAMGEILGFGLVIGIIIGIVSVIVIANGISLANVIGIVFVLSISIGIGSDFGLGISSIIVTKLTKYFKREMRTNTKCE